MAIDEIEIPQILLCSQKFFVHLHPTTSHETGGGSESVGLLGIL